MLIFKMNKPSSILFEKNMKFHIPFGAISSEKYLPWGFYNNTNWILITEKKKTTLFVGSISLFKIMVINKKKIHAKFGLTF